MGAGRGLMTSSARLLGRLLAERRLIGGSLVDKAIDMIIESGRSEAQAFMAKPAPVIFHKQKLRPITQHIQDDAINQSARFSKRS